MTKKALFCCLLILSVVLCSSAFAAQKLTKYTLVVEHEPVALSDKTGYIYKTNTTFMIPLKAVCEALGCKYEDKPSVKGCVITRPDGAEVALRVLSPYVSVDGVKYKLRNNTLYQPKGILTCDVRVVNHLFSGFKNYYASAAKPLGYPGGALAIASDGDLSLPVVTPPVDILPEQLRPAAATSDQIVGVKYISGSRAQMTFYEKLNNAWTEQYSCDAVVGANGIGKTREGDGKTPTGTYALSTPFGILSNPGSAMKGYVKVTKYHYWCSNPASKYYNRLIDTRQVDYTPVAADERLIKISPYYYYAMLIEYNKDCVPGLGSAIFLHCKGSNASTQGCIAIPRAVMKALITTVEEGAKIVIY